jgi:Heat induced stress protein YflT
MTMTERTTAVGVFTDRAQAEQAINDLHNLGFTDRQIGYIVRKAGNKVGDPTPGDVDTESVVADAVGVGVFGGILGAAASLLIPGFGPAIAGGILAATLGGAAIGAVAGGLLGVLTNMGVPEEEAHYYKNEFESGRILVTVQTADRQQEALDVLRRNGAYDATTRANIVDANAYTSNQTTYDATTASVRDTTYDPNSPVVGQPLNPTNPNDPTRPRY